MRPKPYIGVTGFMTNVAVDFALKAFDRLAYGGSRDHLLMVGVLASSKTLRGETNKYPNRYPAVSKIAEIFPPHRRTLNLVHYATDDQHTLREQIEELLKLGGRDLDGFQLNVTWPEPTAIGVGNGKRVVLQLNARALEQAGNDAVTVSSMLADYRTFITDVLIDASGGRGIPIDVEKAEEYVAVISENNRNLGIGIAGGLSLKSLDQINQIKELIERFPFLSIDAEGKLRTSEDHLDIKTMEDYIVEADGLWDH